MSSTDDRTSNDTERRASEAHHRSILQAALDGYWMVDAAGRLLDVNDAYCRISGYSTDELLALRVSDLDVVFSAADIASKVAAAGDAAGVRFQTRHRRKDGTTFDVEASAQAHPGAPDRCVLFLRDVTERKRAEDALRESEERLRALTDHAVAGIATHEIILDAAGRPIDYVFLSANRAFETFTGLRVADVIGRRVTDVLPGIEASGLIERYGRVALTGEPDVFETFVPQLNRSYSLGAYRFGTRRFAVVFVDVSERKRVDEALREREEQMARAMDIAHLADWTFDAATQLFTFNDRFYALYGTSAEREGGYRMPADVYSRFVLSDDEHLVGDVIAQLGAGDNDDHQVEHRIRRRDGSVRDIVVRFRLTRDASGAITGSRGVNQDITDRKRLETQLQHSQRMESIGQLAGGVAHDFNNTLGVIIGHVEMALKQLEPGHLLYDDLEAVRLAANRSADLTRQLLAFARRQTAAPRPLNLNETIDASLAMLRRLIGERIALVWNPARTSWWTKIDPSQVDQILTNLCVNARDAIADVGTITIETETTTLDEHEAQRLGTPAGAYVWLGVSDDGCGMDKETQAHLFEPFFTTKEMGKGTGLGLATVYGIVKQNGGAISVYSQPGDGTTVSVYLPRHTEPVPRPTSAPQPSTLPGHETILLVEDDPALLKLSRRMLASQGYTVVPAPSPEDALRLADEAGGCIDLLMTDVIMPGMNGRDLAAVLLGRYPHMKCLYTSGYTADVIAQHGVLEEGVWFLQKPYPPDILLAKVREVLSS